MGEERNDNNNKENVNILKSRDDNKPFFFYKEDNEEFKPCSASECSWLKRETFKQDELRPRIEPWLTALFQSEYLSLLVGSGLMHAINNIAFASKSASMDQVEFEVFNEQISLAAEESAKVTARKTPNIEDQIRVANELVVGLEHYVLAQKSDKLKKIEEEVAKLKEDVCRVISEFVSSILYSENSLALAEENNREEALNYLVNFLMSFASRTGTRERLQIFTTNYDRLIELGADIAGLHLLDRFIGNLTPIFHSSRLNIDMHYNPPGIRGEPRYLEGVAKYTKLHGSVDWLYTDRVVRRIGLPFGAKEIKPYYNAPGLKGKVYENVMIYPNAAKDRETVAYPYVDLFRDFAVAVCRPNSTLVTYGYSFGDEHINRIIEDMLTIPSTHLVIISYDDSTGRIIDKYNKLARPDQITLLIGNHLGNIKNLVDHYLPKSAIDRTTIRMAKLLKDRLGVEPDDTDAPKNDI